MSEENVNNETKHNQTKNVKPGAIKKYGDLIKNTVRSAISGFNQLKNIEKRKKSPSDNPTNKKDTGPGRQ